MSQRFKKLIEEGRIEPFTASDEEIEDLIRVALRDIETANKVKSFDWDWAFIIAYNSVLRASRAFIFRRGFRVKAPRAHKTVFEFLRLDLSNKYHPLINYFDKIRIKRHIALYETSRLISLRELNELLKKAKKFINLLKESISNV